jgi:hypothetical protein
MDTHHEEKKQEEDEDVEEDWENADEDKLVAKLQTN